MKPDQRGDMLAVPHFKEAAQGIPNVKLEVEEAGGKDGEGEVVVHIPKSPEVTPQQPNRLTPLPPSPVLAPQPAPLRPPNLELAPTPVKMETMIAQVRQAKDPETLLQGCREYDRLKATQADPVALEKTQADPVALKKLRTAIEVHTSRLARDEGLELARLKDGIIKLQAGEQLNLALVASALSRSFLRLKYGGWTNAQTRQKHEQHLQKMWVALGPHHDALMKDLVLCEILKIVPFKPLQAIQADSLAQLKGLKEGTLISYDMHELGWTDARIIKVQDNVAIIEYRVGSHKVRSEVGISDAGFIKLFRIYQ